MTRAKHDPDWHKQAACRDHPHELFFPTGQGKYQEIVPKAQAICKTCPVLVDCRLFAANLRAQSRLYGVWAGVNYGTP